MAETTESTETDETVDETAETEATPEATGEDQVADGETGEGGGETAEDSSESGDEPVVQTPEFAEFPVTKSANGNHIERFYDVSVSVSAEIGRVSMTLGELLRIGEGAVLKLDRQVTAPVELVAQGVRVARGEVVVIDDCFAVRIREIEKA